MDISDDLVMSMFARPDIAKGSGKESLRSKRSVEKDIQFSFRAFERELESEARQQKGEQAGDKQPQKRDAENFSVQKAERNIGTVEPGRQGADIDLLFRMSQLKGEASQPVQNASVVATQNFQQSTSIIADKIPGRIMTAFHDQMRLYPETNVAVTASNKKVTVWIRDFNEQMQNELEEVIEFVTGFFKEQGLPVEKIMLNGKTYREFKE